MGRLAFRFDIDTHKCIRDGVPRLIDISEELSVRFTFFINMGKAISVRDSLWDLMGDRIHNSISNTQMMTAHQKLGNIDYLIAALFNPSIKRYRHNIMMLIQSGNEVGIHGGRNHAKWSKYAKLWSHDKIQNEILWAVKELNKIVPDFSPAGFASPGFNSPNSLDDILYNAGFRYSADYHNTVGYPIDMISNNLVHIGVNLCGEPGGVAFFENCRVRGWSTDSIIEYVKDNVRNNDVTILYDHPYYAGINEEFTIRRIITETREIGGDIVALEDLL